MGDVPGCGVAVAYRGWNDAKFRHENVGFRCVREVSRLS